MDVESSDMVDITFGNETSYASSASTKLLAFGLDTKISVGEKKNQKGYRDPGLRTLVTVEELKSEVSFDADFTLANEHIWPYILCDGDGTGGDPYVWDPDGKMKSMTVQVNDRDEDKKREVLGVAFNEFTMNLAVGEDIKCKMTGLASSISASASSISRPTVDGLDNPFTAEHATVQISSTNNYFGLLQTLDLKVGNDLKEYRDIGGLTVHTVRGHKAIGGLTMGVKKSDSSTKQGIDAAKPNNTDAENITVVIAITDGTRTITITLAGTYIDDFSTGYEAAEDIDESLVFIFSTISVVLAGF